MIPPSNSGATPAAAVAPRGPFRAVYRIEGRRTINPGSDILPEEFTEAELNRLLSHGAVVAEADYSEPPRPGSLPPDSASRFIGTFVRAAVDLLVEPLNGNELRVPQGRVFFAALNTAENAWRAQLAEPAGAPSEKDASVIFELKRGDAGALFRDWTASAGQPFLTCATGFAMSIRKAPEPLPAQPRILVGAAPLAVAKEPPLPAALTARPRRLD